MTRAYMLSISLLFMAAGVFMLLSIGHCVATGGEWTGAFGDPPRTCVR